MKKIIFCVFTLFLIHCGEAKVTVKESQIQIEDQMYGITILKEEVKEFYLKDTMPAVRRKTNGFNAGSVLKGNFELRELGEGKLYVDTKIPPFIYIIKEKGFVILNQDTPEKTKQLFTEIESILKK